MYSPILFWETNGFVKRWIEEERVNGFLGKGWGDSGGAGEWMMEIKWRCLEILADSASKFGVSRAWDSIVKESRAVALKAKHQTWSQIAALLLTGCVTWASYLTSLSFSRKWSCSWNHNILPLRHVLRRNLFENTQSLVKSGIITIFASIYFILQI